jgi:hypothetical protein
MARVTDPGYHRGRIPATKGKTFDHLTASSIDHPKTPATAPAGALGERSAQL